MGIDTTFYSVVGVYFTNDEMLGDIKRVIVNEPSCKHSEQDRSGPYCVKCGTKVSTRSAEYMTDEESKLVDYLHSIDAIRVQNHKTTMDEGWLIGTVGSLDRFNDDCNRYTLDFDSDTLEDITDKINIILRNSPIKTNLEISVKDIKIHIYMDQR